MKIGNVDALNSYRQQHDSAFRIVNANPPLAPSPDPGEEGMIRYNARKKVFEGYINSEWSELVTDMALHGPGGSSGTGNVTKQALKNILSQLFKTSDGTIHVTHLGGSSQHGDGYGINAGEIQALPDHITVPPMNGNTLQSRGIWPQGGNNFIVCNNNSPTRNVNGSVVIDFPKMFKMASGPTAISEGGTGGEFVVGTIEGRIRDVHIKTAGTGYSVGDKISILPGKKWDAASGAYKSAGTGATVSVGAVGANGAVTTVSIDNQGTGYTPEERFNYIFDVVSGLAGNSDGTGHTAAAALVDFSTHAKPAWNVSPDMSLGNNVDYNYGKYMFDIQATANQTDSSAHGFFITCKYICTLYKFKEFSNLV